MIDPDSIVVLEPHGVFHIAVGDAVGTYLESEYNLLSREPRPIISFTTVGEILRLVNNLRYKAAEIRDVETLLKGFELQPVSPEIVTEFGQLAARIDLDGYKLISAKAWVAATCSTLGKGSRKLTLLTCDPDLKVLEKYGIVVEYVDLTPYKSQSFLT